MKTLVVIAIVVAALWLGADWLGGLVGRGRETVADNVTRPVQGLAGNIGVARARVAETNQRIAEVGGTADALAGAGAGGTTAAYGAAARKQIEAAGLMNK